MDVEILEPVGVGVRGLDAAAITPEETEELHALRPTGTASPT